MSLQTRLEELVEAVGTDIKALQAMMEESSMVSVYQSAAATSLVTGEVRAMAFDAEEDDSVPEMHSTTVNNTRLVATKTGPHLIVAGIQPSIAQPTPGLRKNGDNATLQWCAAGANVSGGGASRASGAWLIFLEAGEYVEVVAFQNGSSGATVVGRGNTWAQMGVLIGPKGPKGDKGDPGTQEFFDTAPIGSIISWSRKTYPSDFVLADGQRLSKALFPDAYAVAQAEVAAGNPMWTVRVSDETFTVPNLLDKFLLAPGASRSLGATGGAETHQLSVAEMPPHAHDHKFSFGAAVGTGERVVSLVNAGTGTTQTQNTGGGGSHNNMPPYIVLAQIVKVKGVTVSAGVLQGPTGESGFLAKSGLAANMPLAAIDTKGWLYTATDQGVTYANLDGSSWVRWAADAPTGGLGDFGGFTLPPGWLEADGTAIDRAVYSRLFSALTRTFSGSTVAAPAAGANVITNVLSASLTHIGIGCAIEGPGIPSATVVIGLSADSGGFRNLTLSKNATATNSGATFRALPYGGSDGSTMFNLPDFRGRVTVASGANAGLTERKLGWKDGEETHQLTIAEMPDHSHGTGQPSPNQNFLTSGTTAPWSGGSGGGSLGQFPNTGGAGGGQAHNNMQPFNVARKIIKVY